ncbi:MAG: glycosyltransferase family 9 protein, partial [Planctomycetota bacterium]
MSATGSRDAGATAASHGVLAIRAPNWVGDLVMATPVLEAAAADARFERVAILLREHLVPVLAGGPLENLVAPIARGADESALYRAQRADVALLLSNSFGAAWRAFAARVPLRAGTSLAGRGALLTHRCTPPTRAARRAPVPTAHLLRDAAGLVGIAVPDLHPRLSISAATRERVQRARAKLGLTPAAPTVVCCPGAAFGAAKLWPPERYAAVLDALHARHGLHALVTGGPGEEALVATVCAAARTPVQSLVGSERDLDALKAWIADARLLLVGDSGPRWYAAAFDVPCVSLMGPNFPELTATSLERCEIVRVDGLECAPCLERTCPLAHHRCMRDISVERVLAA